MYDLLVTLFSDGMGPLGLKTFAGIMYGTG